MRVCVCEPEENQSVLSRLYRMSQHGVYSAVKVDWVFSTFSKMGRIMAAQTRFDHSVYLLERRDVLTVRSMSNWECWKFKTCHTLTGLVRDY